MRGKEGVFSKGFEGKRGVELQQEAKNRGV